MRDGQVRRTTSDAFGFVGCDDAGVERFQQRLERGAMRIFGVVALLVIGLDAAQVI